MSSDRTERIAQAASELLARESNVHADVQITDSWTSLDQATAYDVQAEILRQKVGNGERIVGIKLGLTSVAKQKRMNVHAPLTAWLTDAMLLAEGDVIPLEKRIHPRVEPELVFVMGSGLIGPGVTRESAMAAVKSAHGGLEVIDSRFLNYQFTLPDVIADNASAAHFVVGDVSMVPSEIDVVNERVELRLNGAQFATATGEAVQGHPGEALALAANELGKRGIAIEAGWIVLTGGMTDAVVINSGDTVTASFAGLGIVSVRA